MDKVWYAALDKKTLTQVFAEEVTWQVIERYKTLHRWWWSIFKFSFVEVLQI